MRRKSMLGVFLAGLTLVAAPASAQLTVAVQGDQLVVDGVTPGASVAVLGVVHEYPGISLYSTAPFLTGADDDGDGSVTLVYGTPIPEGSTFGVADLSAGVTVLGGPEGARQRVLEEPTARLVSGSGPEPSGLAIKGRLVAVMVARPGVGAWRAIAGDGGASDADGVSNGTILLAPESLRGVDAAVAPPAFFRDGDTVVTIETRTREVSVTVLGDPAGAGAR